MGVSFTGKVKHEIAQAAACQPCCALASAYGVACFSRRFGVRGLCLNTEDAMVAQWAKRQFAETGVAGRVCVRDGRLPGYEFVVDDPFEVEKTLVLFSHTGEETALRIKDENLLCGNCFARFVAAAFMCVGVAPNPEKGYTLEFVSPRYLLLNDLERLLRAQGYTPGRSTRKGSNVLYLKKSEQVEDMLTTMGASQSALEIMNLKIYKDFRNRANRITNCETANIDKTVASNSETLDAIHFLQRLDALDALPQPLRQAARLRLDNPESSLAELVPLSGEPISKSGLSHRYRAIRERAAALRESLGKE